MKDEAIEGMIARVSNWGRWGADDELGTVNLITAAKRQQAASLVRRGEVFSLGLEFNSGGPYPAGDRRLNPHLSMLQTGTDIRTDVQLGAIDGWGYADDMVTMALQCATHWDALGHAFYDYKMYNDRDCRLVDINGASANSIVPVSRRLVSRGVLLDVPRALGVEHLDLDHHITIAELELAAERQRVAIEPGDIVLLRTGNLGRARRDGGWDRYIYTDEPGIGLDELSWVHEKDIAGLAADNWALEVMPSGCSIMLPVHAVGIVHQGLMVGENFVLDELAADCAQDGVYEFLISAAPLPFTKSVSGPVHPIVIK